MTKKDETKLLLAKGNSIINSINNFEEFLDSIPEPIANKSILTKLQLHFDSIKGLPEKYEHIQIDLEALSVTDTDLISSTQFYNKHVDLYARATLLLEQYLPKPGTSSSSSNSVNSSPVMGSSAKLPRISLPSYDGNYTEFTAYQETFLSLIHNNPSLTDVERFLYLKSSLRGAAAQTISNIQPSAENYKVAFDLICERYNNPKLIILNHIKGIFELKQLTKRSAADLRQLYDSFLKHVRALQNLSIPIDDCVSFIYYIILSKLDSDTKSKLTEYKPHCIPTLIEITDFLKQHCQLLEEIGTNVKDSSSHNCYSNHSQNAGNKNFYKAKQNSFQHSLVVTSNKISCPICKAGHFLNQCPKFLALSSKQKFDKASEFHLCKNCLRHSNQGSCNSKYNCQVCHKRHHTLLHLDQTTVNANPQTGSSSTVVTSDIQPENIENSITRVASQTLSCFKNNPQETLLSTVSLKIRSNDNKWYEARAILDSGSHVNFITEDLANKLQLNRKHTNTQILGINSCSAESNSIVQIKIASMRNAFQTGLQCLIIPKISENLPFRSFDKTCLDIPTNIRLADNNFNKSLPVDILIGASHFYNLLCLGQIQLGKDKPILQKTLLGWVISGPFQPKQKLHNSARSYLAINSSDYSTSSDSLENAVQKFWKIEEVFPQNPLSKLSREERFCEENFIRTISRAPDGRFIVSIPFNSNISLLGDSGLQATERFLQLEKRLVKNQTLRSEYSQFINEYISLGHMTQLIPNNDCLFNESVINAMNSSCTLANIPPFYLPHHAVIKATSITTKLRVVFDGSAKSSSNVSINDAQIVGPVVQRDLFSILLQFRQYKIALTGDIEKMYRQILIRPPERKFQRILWRETPESPIQTYELNTITYGTASASYLATRCLIYLSDLYASQFPKTSNILKNNAYMDDILCGGDTVEEVLQIQNELINILASAGFPIRKFLSNHSAVLADNPNCDSAFFTIPLGEREAAKALGITWNSVADVIQYDISSIASVPIVSKRIILSTVAQLFDPLGLLSPVIIIGKLLIQKLWQLQLSWDEGIPEHINSEWRLFKAELPLLNSIAIPRYVLSENSTIIQLHGFSDSSSHAYGACIYLRCMDAQGIISTQLLCSKSRVAPLRSTTIPRLELCAALLLAQLMQKVKDSLTIRFHSISLWSDSTIVLNWINSAPNRYKTFVANRIAAIQEISTEAHWYHVPSEQNPADLVSRGLSASNLLHSTLWWHGPPFLALPLNQWPPKPLNKTCEGQNSELKTDFQVATSLINVQIPNIFNKFSRLSKLKRVVAWIFRFIKNSQASKEERIHGNLQPTELQGALNRLITLCQAEAFPQELKHLKSQQVLKTSSAILSLSPFLDEIGIIRVGGRMKNSEFSFDKKFPVLLPKSHVLTQLIFKHFHELQLHCGAQHLLAVVRESYWPISGRNTAKRITHNCTKCFRVNPQSCHPLMDHLPAKRLQVGTPAFSYVGVDYAGPILIKDRKLRGSRLLKSYICLFVCLVSRAIHLELVTSLTTDAFIATLRRFIGRRGKPISISSDNATNFRGAANQLKELYMLLKAEKNRDQISNFMADQEIKWEFITPRSPHQGGIWESGVKSVKTHLKKILGNTSLNYEDFSTLLIQIEAVLNSRPLSPLSADPLDTAPLTPGHFLITRSFTSLPEVNLDHISENRLSLYQRIQQMVQGFWRRWSREVVPELQRRTKWFKSLPELVKVNSLVLVKDDNLPPLQWMLGRVIVLHTSADGVVRSVTLKISNGHSIKRSVHNLCVLPE